MTANTVNAADAFVAYPAADPSLTSFLADALARANSRSNRVRFIPWEINDIAGRPLSQPITGGIEKSIYVVADITRLNPNVTYEIGYAIGRGKRVFLVRRAEFSTDTQLAQEVGIFDTLGYKDYSDADALAHYLANLVDETALPVPSDLDRHAPVYVVEPPVKSEAATAMTSRLKKNARYRYRSFNPSEDIRLSAADAIRQVGTSAGVLLTVEDHQSRDGAVHNLRTMFVAGLAHGMAKPALVLCPAGYVPPLDIRDEVKRYRDSDDIGRHINALSLEITEYLQQATAVLGDRKTILQSLRIGDPTAENEMATLAQYYLPLSEYQRALRGEVNLVVGRKGSGKTALFIRVRDQVRNDKRNVVVDLKPEGYQLIKLKETIFDYLSEGARQHLITAFWEYLLLLEVAYKLLEKDQSTYRHNHEIRGLYEELSTVYYSDASVVGGDFSERLLALSRRLSDAFLTRFGTLRGQRLTAQEVSELVHVHDIRALRKRIVAYLEHKRAAWVLFDNLDKGWSTQGVDEVDAIILQCLIEAGRKIEREMRRAGHDFHCVVFVRNDVYENLMRSSADYGKEMRAVLDWTDPDLLREMLRLRLVSSLDSEYAALTFEDLWPRICISHYDGDETSGYMVQRSLMRPRNLLKLFGHCLAFANNFGRTLIAEEDIEKGLLAYSHDLLIELDRELSDVSPATRDVLYHFIDAPITLKGRELDEVLMGDGGTLQDAMELREFLLYYGVVGLRLPGGDLYIYNVNYDSRILSFRVERAGSEALFVINPAFWPVLGIGARAGIERGSEA